MTTYPASAKQINWIKDMLDTKDWANSGQDKYISRAAVIKLMIGWATDLDAKLGTGDPRVPDGVRKVMGMYSQIGDRINAGLQFVRNSAVSNFAQPAAGCEYLYDDFDSKAASKLIEWLRPMAPKAPVPNITVEVAETPAEPVELEDGMYKVSETIYKVYHTQKGFQVAKKLMVEGRGDDDYDTWFEYAGKAPLKSIRPEHRMSHEEMREFGALYGTCCCCGRTLTDELSIALGIGPICGSREFGEPFKKIVKATRLQLKKNVK